MKNKFLTRMQEGGAYHVYNRTNNKEPLFKTDDHRRHFIRQFIYYLYPFTELYCWCLLSNHFHFLIRVRSANDIRKHLKEKSATRLINSERQFLKGEIAIDELLENCWRRFFTSYAMAFNKSNERKGNLFHRPFKRIHLENDEAIIRTVVYIHANPQKHRVVNKFTKYNWTSWHEIFNQKKSWLSSDTVLLLFGGKEKLLETHYNFTEYYYSGDIEVED